MTISKFGQWLKLTATNKDGSVILETSELRVDFDIREVKGYTRAKFDVYNLSAKTIGLLSNSEVYLSLDVSLHDDEPVTLYSSLFVSNVIEEMKVPNSVTSLFCTSSIKQEFLDVDIHVVVNKPTLRNNINEITNAAGLAGRVIFKYFPDEVLDELPPRPKAKHEGTLMKCLDKLAYGRFDYYTQGINLLVVYRPDFENVRSTEMYEDENAILLDTKNMRSNPRLGPATLSIVSNLDSRIVPSTILDVSKLLTAAPNTSEISLQQAKDILKDKVAGFDRYRVYQVQHKGSNFTRDWNTSATATSPTIGKKMATNNWFT
jgi:hypothetical protein